MKLTLEIFGGKWLKSEIISSHLTYYLKRNKPAAKHGMETCMIENPSWPDSRCPEFMSRLGTN